MLSKYLERRSAAASLAGRRAVELGAGCGLVSCVLARLGAHVTATDMADNLPLLRENLRANGARCAAQAAPSPTVAASDQPDPLRLRQCPRAAAQTCA